MKVLHGVSGQAGQPWTLAEGLRQIGIDADSISISNHKFGYPTHRILNLSQFQTPSSIYNALLPLIEEYDVFHFHARSFMMHWPDITFPSLEDIALLKMHGKKVFFHFRGQEIRLASMFKEMNPFHYVDDESGYLFTKMPDRSKLIFRDTVTSLCDGVFTVDPELQTYVPNAHIVPRALDARQWDYAGFTNNPRPLVVHAPSRRGVKGTDAILMAVEELKDEGVNFDFMLVENLTHERAKQIYIKSDIIIDQLRIGWYGVLGVEALALGKPLIAYIRDDLYPADEEKLPIVNANTATIKNRLRDIILDKQKREHLSMLGRDYFLRTHASTAIAEKLATLYEAPLKTHDFSGYLHLHAYQHALSHNNAPTKKSRTKIRHHLLLLRSRVNHTLNIWKADGAKNAVYAVLQYLNTRLKRR